MSFTGVTFYGNIKLDNIHAQDRVLDYSDLLTQDYYLLQEADYTTPVSFSGTYTALYIKSIALDSNRILVHYYTSYSGNYYHYFIILDSDGVVLSSYEHIAFQYNSQMPGMIKVDTDKVLVTLGYNSIEGRAFLIDTSSDIITIHSYAVFATTEITLSTVDILDSSTAIVSYKEVSGNAGKIQVLNISGWNVSSNISDEETFFSNITNATITMLDEFKGLIVYTSGVNLSLNGIILNILGSVITINLSYEIDTIGEDMSVYKISDSKLVTCYNHGIAYMKVLTISGNTIVPHTYTVLENNVNSDVYSIAMIDTTTGIVTCRNTNIIKYGIYYIFTVNDNLIRLESTETFWSNFSNYFSAVTLDSDTIFLAFQGRTSGTYKAKTVKFSNFATGSTKEDYEQVWNDDYTVFLANFENNLEAGNVSGTITGWRLKRKASDGSLYITMDDFDTDVTEYIDNTPRNNIEYSYAIYSLNSSLESLGIEDTATVSFFGWFLTDGTNYYKFDMGWDGLSTDSIKSNKNMFLFENYTQYPVASFGIQDYKTSSITTIPYVWNDVDLTYEIDVPLLNELQTFINDGNEKWLKNTAGEIMKVITNNFSYKYLDKQQNQPYEITFEWTEVGVGEEGL